MTRVAVVTLFILGAALWYTGSVSIAAGDTYQTMDQLSEQVLQLTKKEEWLEAKNVLWKLSTVFSRHNWGEMDISVEGIHALSETLVQAKRALTRMEVKPHEAQMYAVQMRLAFDALQNREQPLWHEYYNIMREDVTQLKDRIPNGKKTEIQKAIDRLYVHYQLIRPALFVARSPEVVEQVNGLFTFMGKQVHDVGINREPLHQAVEKWEKLLDPLFYGTDEQVLAVGAVPRYPIYPVVWVLAVLIGAVLAYVALKKAQNEGPRRVVKRG